jgi:hypothetical protein
MPAAVLSGAKSHGAGRRNERSPGSQEARGDLPLTVASTAADLPTATIPRRTRHQARRSRRKLVFASAAKLRGGGPILTAVQRPCARLGCRHLGSSSAARHRRDDELQKFHPPYQVGRHAGRRVIPTGASPVVTNRQSVMSSFRASATIMVLRMPPRAPRFASDTTRPTRYSSDATGGPRRVGSSRGARARCLPWQVLAPVASARFRLVRLLDGHRSSSHRILP